MSYALEGIKILDFGIFLAGPWADKVLADLGADVLKVEEFNGDPWRDKGTNAMFPGISRGKRSLAIDLKTQEGRQIVHQLAKDADVIHHNMRVGVAERLAIDYETLKKINPQIIYCHSAGFGTGGPRSMDPTFEPLHSAFSGILHMSAGEGNPPIMYPSNMDIGNGYLGVSAILMALVERSVSGEGQYVESPQTASAMFCTSDVFFDEKGQISEYNRLDHEQMGIAPLERLYRTKGDGWICIACQTQEEWERLSQGVELPQLASDPRYATLESRKANAAELVAALEKRFAERTDAEWFQTLDDRKVPCEIPRGFQGDTFLNDPENLKSGAVVEIDHPLYGKLREIGQVIRFSETPGVIQRPGPLLGEHTQEVLKDLGYNREQILELKEKKVVNWAPEVKSL